MADTNFERLKNATVDEFAKWLIQGLFWKTSQEKCLQGREANALM